MLNIKDLMGCAFTSFTLGVPDPDKHPFLSKELLDIKKRQFRKIREPNSTIITATFFKHFLKEKKESKIVRI